MCASLTTVAALAAVPAAHAATTLVAQGDYSIVAADGSGNVYGTGNASFTISKFSETGVPRGSFGGYGTGTGQLGAPIALETSSDQRLFVADLSYDNFPAQEFTPAGAFVRTFGICCNGQAVDVAPYAGGVLVLMSGGWVQRFTAAGVEDGSFATPATSESGAMTVSPVTGNVLILGVVSRVVREYTTDGEFVRTWVAGGNSNGRGIAIDSGGRVYVVSEGSVQRYTATGEPLDVYAFEAGGENLDIAGDVLYTTRYGAIYRTEMGVPEISLGASEQAPHTSQEITLSVSPTVPFGRVTRVEWDLDGDGGYELDAGTATSTTTRYARAGNVAVGVRVTSNVGRTAKSTLNVGVLPSQARINSPGSALTDTAVRFDASGSAVPNSAIEGVEWDLDGDGSFETRGAGTTIDHSFAKPGPATVGLRVSRSAGVVDTATASLTVHPKPPGGPVGVSINAGARFTNDSDVHVAVVWPAGADALVISNDGGFVPSSRRDVGTLVDWRLDQSGPERLPKTIYVRFDGATQTYQDDIILDQTPPTISAAKLGPSKSTGAGASAARQRRYVIRVKAKDRTSGISSVQAAFRKGKPGRAAPFRKRVTVKSAKRPRYARVKDRAGNWSKWRRLKRS